MHATRKTIPALPLAALALSAHPAQAQAVYTSLPAFQAATSGLSDVRFSGIAPAGGFVNYSSPPGLTLSGVNFSLTVPPTGGGLDVTSKTYYGANTYANDFLIEDSSSTTPGLTEKITLPGSATAVGVGLGTFSGSAVTFTFSNGQTYTDPATVGFGSTAFVGFTTTSPFTSFTISDAGSDPLVLDDLKFGSATPSVPEPSTWAAFAFTALGAAALTLRARRRQSSPAA